MAKKIINKATPNRQLSLRQLKFIEIYEGNGTEAAKLAGYSGDENTLGVTAYDLLRNPKIVHAIRERNQTLITSIVATRKERQEFWTLIMNDDKASIRDKLKASELLGKSEADFTENIDLHDKSGIAERLTRAKSRRK